MTPCDAPRCRDAARWAVGPDDRQLCRRHMLDVLLASGFGQAYAVPLAAEPLEAQPEPVAMLTAEEREAMEAAASWLDASDDPEANRRADAIYGFLNRAK
jgi:hypothetical protein